MKEKIINNWMELTTMKKVGIDRIKKLSKQDDVIKVLNDFRNEHPTFKGYTNILLTGYLTHLKNDINDAPMCPICGKNRSLIDSQFYSWNTTPIKYNPYCVDCRDQWVANKISSVAMSKSAEEKYLIAEKKSNAWNDLDEETYKRYCQNRKDAFDRRDPEVERLRVERSHDGYRNRTPEQKAETRKLKQSYYEEEIDNREKKKSDREEKAEAKKQLLLEYIKKIKSENIKL